jgi:purine-binding chemotaxis protein CheW
MTTQRENKANSYLSFQVGAELFAANVSNVLNILEMTKITRVPKSPDYLKGVINLRGNVLPVLDTRIKFGLPETEYTTNTCILVLDIKMNKESLQLGAIVDSVSEVLELTNDQISPPPSLGNSYETEYLSGMAKHNDNFIMIIDTNKVFADDEIINISDISSEQME